MCVYERAGREYSKVCVMLVCRVFTFVQCVVFTACVGSFDDFVRLDRERERERKEKKYIILEQTLQLRDMA